MTGELTILIDIRTTDLTLREAMEFIRKYQNEHPNMEVWMDGDLYSVVACKRCNGPVGNHKI